MADRLTDIMHKLNVTHDPAATKPVAQPSACAPDCKVCGGLGWVMGNYEITDARFGKIHPCPNADIFLIYGHKLGIDKADMGLTWKGINPNGNARIAARKVYDALERGYGMVYLWGAAGTGKTRILKTAIAEWLRLTRKPAAYAGMSDIVDYLRSSFDADNANELATARIDFYAAAPLLSIDEMDKMRGTEYAAEKRFTLLDRRYELAARELGVTLMASNNDPHDFLDSYLLSRIYDGRNVVIQMTGADTRPAIKNERI